jgi:hypothetical protein
VSLADVQRLSRRLRGCQRDLDILDSYYDGTQALGFLTDSVREAIGPRLAALVVNWPELVLDSIEQRLDVQGFRLGGQDEADDKLWSTWQRSNMDEESQVCHLESMLYGRTAVSVWTDPDDDTEPLIALETPREVILDFAPGTRKVRSALKQWVDGQTVYVTMAYPDYIEKYEGTSRRISGDSGSSTLPQDISGMLKQVDTFDNPLGEVPFVPYINRRRTKKLNGKSELDSIIPLADAINKLATDMMVTSEFHAEPRRYATGIQIPSAGGAGEVERQRLKEQVKKEWDLATAGKTWLGGTGVNFGQFAAADLANFTNALHMLFGVVAALGALPPHYVGLSADANPASADAIRSAEASLVKRATRKQTSLGGSHETTMRLAEATRRGIPVRDLPEEFRSMETVWSDPETRTIGTMADAVQKMSQGDNPIISRQTGQEWLGMSPQARKRDEQFRQDTASTAATADVQAKLDLAKQLQTDQGLSQAAAFAAVGLIVAAGQISADPASQTTP